MIRLWKTKKIEERKEKDINTREDKKICTRKVVQISKANLKYYLTKIVTKLYEKDARERGVGMEYYKNIKLLLLITY